MQRPLAILQDEAIFYKGNLEWSDANFLLNRITNLFPAGCLSLLLRGGHVCLCVSKLSLFYISPVIFPPNICPSLMSMMHIIQFIPITMFSSIE